MGCAPGEDYDAGLCYPANRDPAKYSCVGPVCWMKVPPGFVDCGAGVARSITVCGIVTTAQIAAAGDVAGAVLAAGKAAVAAKRAARVAAEPEKALAAAKAARRFDPLWAAITDSAKMVVKGGDESISGVRNIKKAMGDIFWSLDKGDQAFLVAAGAGVKTAQIGYNWQPDGLYILRTMADLASFVDPLATGVPAAIAAYAYPVWGVDYPF